MIEKEPFSAKVKYSRIKRKILGHITLVRIFFIALIFVIVFLFGLFVNKTWYKVNASMYLKSAYNFWKAPVSELASSDGKTNILVMGKAGGAHDGPDLTDTMMIVSVSINSPDVKIISIPRDTWIPEIRAKINSSYYWGTQKPVGGINFAKVIASGVVGIPIQYGAVIDFSGFRDVIDELGGIEVYVPNTFTDYYYPIAGRENDTCGGRDPEFMCRYETLRFTQGKLLMNGETALKFVRSRHASGIEGTDIAREARQQQVITALKNKLSDKSTYTNVKKDLAIINVVLKSVQTDLDYPTASILARKVYDSKDSIKSYLIPNEMLINPPISEKYDMQSVFVPRLGNGKWEEINKWVKNLQ